jgi:hypothetical protein
MAAEIGTFRVVGRLDLDVARQQADFAALVDAIGDCAEVHVVQRLVERERIAADGGNRALFRLVRIEIGRGEDDPVALAPAGGIQHRNPGAAGFGRPGELAPAVLAIAMQAERAAHHHDATVPHRIDVFVGDGLSVSVMVALWVCGLASLPMSSAPPAR